MSPEAATKMLEGLRSRCIIRRSCMCCSAQHTCTTPGPTDRPTGRASQDLVFNQVSSSSSTPATSHKAGSPATLLTLKSKWNYRRAKHPRTTDGREERQVVLSSFRGNYELTSTAGATIIRISSCPFLFIIMVPFRRLSCLGPSLAHVPTISNLRKL